MGIATGFEPQRGYFRYHKRSTTREGHNRFRLTRFITALVMKYNSLIVALKGEETRIARQLIGCHLS